MSIKHILSIIKSNNLYEFRKKISDIYWALYNRFLEKYIGRIPTPEAWQGQWFAYNKIKKKYLRAPYEIDSIFPQVSINTGAKNI